MLPASTNRRLNEVGSKHAPWVQLYDRDFAIGLLATVSAAEKPTLFRSQDSTQDRANIWPAVLSARDFGEFAR